MNYNDNFNLFWGRRHLFRADGLHPSRSGAKVVMDHFWFSLRRPSARPKITHPDTQQPRRHIIAKNNNNAYALFSAVNRLTNPPVSVAPVRLSTESCNEFASFFTDKIQKIRQVVSSFISGIGFILSLQPLKLI